MVRAQLLSRNKRFSGLHAAVKGTSLPNLATLGSTFVCFPTCGSRMKLDTFLSAKDAWRWIEARIYLLCTQNLQKNVTQIWCPCSATTKNKIVLSWRIFALLSLHQWEHQLEQEPAAFSTHLTPVMIQTAFFFWWWCSSELTGRNETVYDCRMFSSTFCIYQDSCLLVLFSVLWNCISLPRLPKSGCDQKSLYIFVVIQSFTASLISTMLFYSRFVFIVLYIGMSPLTVRLRLKRYLWRCIEGVVSSACTLAIFGFT